MARIGVEPALTDVEQALRERGHEVVQLNNAQDAAGCDCCVVSGQEQNMTGDQQTFSEASIISARGLTADEICNKVDEKTVH